MFDPRWRKVWRDARLHMARTLLVVLAIAIGIAGAGTILDAWALVQRATRETYLASDPVSATLRTDSVDDALLAVARAVPGVSAARARREAYVAVRAQGTWQSALLFASTDYADRRIGKLEPQAGAWPPPDGAIVVERSSVSFSGVSIGDPVSIVAGGADPRAMPVAGIVRDVSVAPGWMEHAVYGFVTPQTLARLGLPRSLNEIQLLVSDRRATQDDVRRIAYRVKAAVERAGHPVSDVDVPVPGEHIHAAQMDSLLYTQGAFGVLALVVCGFLVVNLITAMLAGQVREIGVMKTLGARPEQLARMYLAYAAALGVAASLVALPVSACAGRSYGALRAELLNFDISGYAIPWWAVGLQLVAATMLPLAAAAIPVRRGCRLPVATALRDFGLAHGAKTEADHWSKRIRGLPRPTLLSIRNAFRKRQRMTLTLLALATGGAVYIGAANLRRSVLGAVDLLYAGQTYDFTVRLAEPHEADSVEAVVSRVAGVAAAEAWAGARAAVAHDGATLGNAFSITAPPAGSRLFAPPVEQGRWLRATGERGLVVSRSLVKSEPALRIGQRAMLQVGDSLSEWTIVGVVNAGPAPSAYTVRETIARLAGHSRVSTVVVASALSGTGARVDLIQRVRGALDRAGMRVAVSQLLEESRRVMEDHLLMVVQFLSAMGWVMIVVGGMGLTSTMSLAVLERTREIGVLRAIGARHRSIMAMVQAEGLVIAVASWACAIPLSIPVSIALAKAFSRAMLEVPVTVAPSVGSVASWLALVMALSVVACAWPAARASRVTIARALAYE